MYNNNNNKSRLNGPTSPKACNRNKNINNNVKITKHFQPSIFANGVNARLPYLAVPDSERRAKTTPQTNPTTTARSKPLVRPSKLQNAHAQHQSSSVNINEVITKMQQRTRQPDRKSTADKIPQVPKSVPESKKFSQSYIDTLKNEINQFKTVQTNLLKTADDLKAEIRDFRVYLTSNIFPSELEVNEYIYGDTSATQTNYDDLNSHSYYAVDKESFNSEKTNFPALRAQPSRTSQKSSSLQSSNVSSASSLMSRATTLSIIPEWVFENESEDLSEEEPGHTHVPLNDVSNKIVNDHSVTFVKYPENSAKIHKESMKQTTDHSDKIQKSKHHEQVTNKLKSRIGTSSIVKQSELTVNSVVKTQTVRVGSSNAAKPVKDQTLDLNLTAPVSESSVISNGAVEKKSRKNDEYAIMLKQQQNQIKIFSDVIDKAQYLVTLLNNDLKERIPKSPVKAVVQLYNVGTQADEKNENKKSGNKNKRKEGNDTRTERDDGKTKPMDTTSGSSLKKLSTHLLPSVEIPRELVTQKIPSVNIDSGDYTAENTKEDNNVILSIKHGSEDDQELHKLIDIVREMRELSDSKSAESIKSVERAIFNETIPKQTNRNLDAQTRDTLQEIETNVVIFNNDAINELEDTHEPRERSSSLAVNVGSGSNQSIHSIITRNRERLDESNKQHYLTGDLLQKYQQAISSRKLSKELKMDDTVTGNVRKTSKTKWAPEKVNTNLDGTTQIILSVDKVNLSGKLSHTDSMEGLPKSSSPERSSNKRPLQNLPATKNYDSNGEHYIMHDMRMQTMSAIALFGESGVIKNSKESSVIVNTDDAFRIIHVSDSAEDEAGGSCCANCFGRRRRRLNNDGYGSAVSSVQYLRNKESPNNTDGNLPRNKVHMTGESTAGGKKKSDDQQIEITHIRVSNAGKVPATDRKKEEPQEKTDGVRINAPKTNSKCDSSVSPSPHIASPENQKDSVESFIKVLTNVENVDVNPIAQSDYTKSEVLEFIKKSSETKSALDDHKKNLTLMNVNIDQPVIEYVDSATGAGGDKNYTELVTNENEEIQSTSRFYPKKVRICTNIHNRAIQDNQHSDGEILNKSDCSIGEVDTCSGHPESVFKRDLRRSHQKIINKRVHNSNWISYHVAPISSSRTYASRPVNDSSSES